MLRIFYVLLIGIFGLISSCSQNITIPGVNNGTPSSSSLAGIVCGVAMCSKGQTCHYFAQNKPLCVGKEGVPKEIQEGDKGTASIACDGPEDCESTQECAHMIRATGEYSSVVLCTNKRDISWAVVCHDSAQCPASHPVCKTYKTNYMDPFKVCSKA